MTVNIEFITKTRKNVKIEFNFVWKMFNVYVYVEKYLCWKMPNIPI